MSEAFRPVYESCLELIKALIEMDPAPDTPGGKMLVGLATAVETYEKVRWPYPAIPPAKIEAWIKEDEAEAAQLKDEDT
jgi:hypothetical protein